MFKDFRTFSKNDWYGWGGAYKLPDGSGPFIRDLDALVIVVSGSGDSDNLILANVVFDDYGSDIFYAKEFTGRAEAEVIINAVSDKLDEVLSKGCPEYEDPDDVLRDFGFKLS